MGKFSKRNSLHESNNQTFAAGHSGNLARSGANVEDDRLLDPGDEEVSPLATDLGLDSGEPVEYHSPLTTVN